MKKLFASALILICLGAKAQVCIGKADYITKESKKNSTADINALKKTKTIFVLSDVFPMAEYTKILSETWKITNFEVISTKEFEANPTKYKTYTNSIAELSAFSQVISYSSGSVQQNEYLFIKMNLYLFDDIKEKSKDKIKYETNNLATLFFTPSRNMIGSLMTNGALKNVDYKDVFNYKTGYLKNYFKIINDNLVSNSNLNCFDELRTQELKQLKTKKLYVSSEMVSKDGDDELLKEYEYAYEKISDQDLSNKILAGDDFYYLVYSQINSKKILTIINSKTGNIIYNDCSGMSFFIKSKDFKEISKQISK